MMLGLAMVAIPKEKSGDAADRIVEKIYLLRHKYPKEFALIDPLDDKIRKVNGSIKDFIYFYNIQAQPNPDYRKVGGWSGGVPNLKTPEENGLGIFLYFRKADGSDWSELMHQRIGGGLSDGNTVVFYEVIAENSDVDYDLNKILEEEGFTQPI